MGVVDGARLTMLRGGQSPEADAWDARFELALANSIRRLLVADPPPSGTAYAHDAELWAANLGRSAQGRLDDVGRLQLLSSRQPGEDT